MFNLFASPPLARCIVSFAILFLGCTLQVRADPGYYLVTVYEDEGKARIDYRYWTVKFQGTSEIVWPEIGIGYGVTKRWYTEIFSSFIGDKVASSKPSTLNWQNDFLLTQGQYDIDLALHTNLVIDQAGTGADALEFGPVVQTDVGRVQLNGNLIFEQSLSGEYGHTPQLKYQWQAKYRWNAALHTGVQGFGELGDWNNWSGASAQSHRWGPMVSGSIPVGAKHSVEYQAALLKGKVYASDCDMLSVRLQYLF
jgi:hypothetical protein